MSCHAGKKDNHPTRGYHLVSMPDKMKEEFDFRTAKWGVYLPLPNNLISCTTCHNPHQEGVIKRKEAKAGSSKSSFLRISRGRKLCTTCHTNLNLPRRSTQREAVSSSGPERSVDHKPYREEKCKACHAVDGFNPFRREKLFLCFQTGCHEPTMLDHSSVHEPSVLGSCTFCHNPHNSGHEKLLFNTGDRLCSTCHPLLRDEHTYWMDMCSAFGFYGVDVPLNLPDPDPVAGQALSSGRFWGGAHRQTTRKMGRGWLDGCRYREKSERDW